MIFKKITILILVTIFCFSNAIADNHDTEQNILDKNTFPQTIIIKNKGLGFKLTKI